MDEDNPFPSTECRRAGTVAEETITWRLKPVHEEGDRALVQLSEPVNRFPAYVAYLVRWLKSMRPTMSKLRRAQTLGRAGLHLGATTVRESGCSFNSIVIEDLELGDGKAEVYVGSSLGIYKLIQP